MRKILFPFLLLTLLLLNACQAQEPESSAPTPSPSAAVMESSTPTLTPEPEETPEPDYSTPWPDTSVALNELDLSSYETQLSPAEWEALSGFFPVLNNQVPMLADHLSSREEGVTPTEEVFFFDIYKAYGSEDIPSVHQRIYSFSLTPVAGKELDLTLAMNNLGGWYLLIHREGEQFYAVYMPIRWFEMLQSDGLYVGSGGAAVHYYYRLHFSDGTFTAELLANTDWGEQDEEGRYLGYYAIGGQQVTEEEFFDWQEETLVGDATWYPAR